MREPLYHPGMTDALAKLDDMDETALLGVWIGCEKDWRPAPYTGCNCYSCNLVRSLTPGTKEHR